MGAETDLGLWPRIVEFGRALLPYWWLFISSGVLVIEPIIESFFSGPEWLERNWPNNQRRKQFRWAAVLALFLACFMAFDAANERNRQLVLEKRSLIEERNNARRQRDANLSPIQQQTIDRLSGDLAAVRGQIDAQKRQIKNQQTPRHLSAEQTNALVAALAPYHGQKVELSCLVTSFDCVDFATDFQSVFKQAEWDTPNTINVAYATGHDPQGIEVTVNPQMASEPNNMPPSLRVLIETIANLHLIPEPAIFRTPSVEQGTISFRIGRIQSE